PGCSTEPREAVLVVWTLRTRITCMSTDAHNLPHLHNLDTEIVARYIDQPPRLPAELRRQVEASWNGAPVQLYALADLDHALRLTQVWVALGPRPSWAGAGWR